MGEDIQPSFMLRQTRCRRWDVSHRIDIGPGSDAGSICAWCGAVLSNCLRVTGAFFHYYAAERQAIGMRTILNQR